MQFLLFNAIMFIYLFYSALTLTTPATQIKTKNASQRKKDSRRNTNIYHNQHNIAENLTNQYD